MQKGSGQATLLTVNGLGNFSGTMNGQTTAPTAEYAKRKAAMEPEARIDFIAVMELLGPTPSPIFGSFIFTRTVTVQVDNMQRDGYAGPLISVLDGELSIFKCRLFQSNSAPFSLMHRQR